MAKKAKAAAPKGLDVTKTMTAEERFNKHVPGIQRARKELERTQSAQKIANGEYRNKLKAFKADGGDIDALVDVMRDQKREIDEVESYLQESAAALEASGVSPGEARRTARLELGNSLAVREQVRSYGWENLIERPLSDLRYAARRLRGSPGFTAVCVLTLALGVGANSAIFSVINGVLLKPLPYLHPDELIDLNHTAPGVNFPDADPAPFLYFTYREQGRSFQSLGLYQWDSRTVTGLAQPEVAQCLTVTAEVLPILGVQLELGRLFSPKDDAPGSPLPWF